MGMVFRPGTFREAILAEIAADERIDAYRHPLPTERRIDRRVMVVVGAERYGLHCSATRLISFGAMSNELRRRHDAVVHVDARMIAETRPGRTLGEVFAAAQRAYAEAGFGGPSCGITRAGGGGMATEASAARGSPSRTASNAAIVDALAVPASA